MDLESELVLCQNQMIRSWMIQNQMIRSWMTQSRMIRNLMIRLPVFALHVPNSVLSEVHLLQNTL